MQRTYYAKSVLGSKTLWTNVVLFVIAVLELTEVINVVPAEWHGAMLAIGAILNVALRIFTVRPVAFVAPGDVKPVSVESVESRGTLGA